MKTLLVPMFLAAVLALRADTLKPESKPEPKEESPSESVPTPPPVPRGLEFSDQPQVTVDLLAVSLATEKALPLLAELRDPKRIKEAQTKLLDLVAKKDAKMLGWPEVTTLSGTRAVSEAITEYKYPIEFQSPGEVPKREDDTEAKLEPGWKIEKPVGVTIETKNIGTTLDVEPVVKSEGSEIMIAVEAQTVEVVKTAEFYSATNPKGDAVNSPHVIFGTRKVSTTLRLRNGQRMLLQASQLKEDDERTVIFIIGAKLDDPD